MKIKEIEIPNRNYRLKGTLTIPKDAKEIIIFAHGSGSSRFSPRNQFVAKELQKAGFSTLLIDLLTDDEEKIDQKTAELRFDITLLAERLVEITRWIKKNPTTKNFILGYFGASTGAAAALIAAAKIPDIKAVVSRGGRPDLAIGYLAKVKSPTLLIVGGNDISVIETNKEALKSLNKQSKIEIIDGATHLFEEPGKLEKVAELAANWFMKYLKD